MSEQSREIWIQSDDGRSMCALINGEVGWLMYLRYSDDAGFSSRNPDFAGDPNATVRYTLENGQVDEYPLSWTYPIAVIERAVEHFRNEGRPPNFISWHNDSGDGKRIR